MAVVRNKLRLGDVLIAKGIITEEQLGLALKEQKKKGLLLGDTLIVLGYISQDKLIEVLSEQLDIEYVDLRKANFDDQAVNLVNENLVKRYTAIPIRFDDQAVNMLVVAMADPMNIAAIDDIGIVTGMRIKPVLSTATDISAQIDKYFGKKQAMAVAEQYKKEQSSFEVQDDEENLRRDNVENAPIVQLVKGIIEQAVRQRASDIHIEPSEDEVRIRYRVDGGLFEAMTYDKALLTAIVARLKIISGMDISEKRKPQDGRISTVVDRREYDIRVSNLPTVYGEKIVMRIASKEGFNKSKSELGFRPEELKRFDDILKNPHGIILVTGPTGSGKSTTLYTALNELNTSDVNIVTVEDPVEANIKGINQVQVNVKADMTFASALRSILRQDPDIIMIGEIRDTETAQIAVKASITGHLVCSTLHTNSTASSITRLADMGVEPYLISDAVVGIIAQRLIRRLCECKEEVEPTQEEIRLLGLDSSSNKKIYKPKGCKVCSNTGYYGRIGVYEIMPITPSLKRLISANVSADEINDMAVKEGMRTLKVAAADYVKEGITSMSEILKITYEA